MMRHAEGQLYSRDYLNRADFCRLTIVMGHDEYVPILDVNQS